MLKLFQKRQSTAREDEFFARLDAIERDVAGRFSRGNFAMQDGCVLEEDELEAERDQVRRDLISKAK